MPGRTRRSTREDWINAAYEAAGRGGVDAISIEPIAAALGVTKGGFYYRFAAREELIAATLDHWTGQARELMMQCTGIADPIDRLRSFLRLAVSDQQLRRADSWFFLHSSPHSLVGPVARQAAQENVAWFTEVLIEAGLPAAEAGPRAHLCWSAYLGMVAELMTVDEAEAVPADFAEVDLLVTLVVARTAPDRVK